MKRKIIVFIFVILFNVVLLEGINYTNRFMFSHDFLIHLKEREPIQNEEGSDLPSDDPNETVNTDYEGESVDKIGDKIEKYLKDTILEGYGKYISSAAIRESVNPYLIGGIVLVNTKCEVDCSIIAKNCNNVGDLKGSPGCFGGSYKKYDSIEASVDDLVKYIYDNFYVNDIKSPNYMYKKMGKDVVWAFKVNEYMGKLKKGR